MACRCRSFSRSRASASRVSQSRQRVRTKKPLRCSKLGSGRPASLQSVFAERDHLLGAGADSLDVAGQIERFCEKWVVGHGGMIAAKVVERQRARQRAGVPDLEAICEQAHLDRGVAVVVAMGNRVHDRFGDGVGRQLVGARRLVALRARAHAAVDLAEHEVARLIDLFEDIPAVDLERRERAQILGAVRVYALDRGGGMEALRVLAGNTTAAFIGLPSSSSLRCVSSALVEVFCSSGNPRNARAVSKNQSMRLRERSTSLARSHALVSKGGMRSAPSRSR